MTEVQNYQILEKVFCPLCGEEILDGEGIIALNVAGI